MSLTCSVARKAVIRNTHNKGHQGGLAQEYRASFKQVQRSRMAALRATLRAKARASVPALRQLERRPVFLHCRALPQKLSLWLNTSNSLNPCTRPLPNFSLRQRMWSTLLNFPLRKKVVTELKKRSVINENQTKNKI